LSTFTILWFLCRHRHKNHYADLSIMPILSLTKALGRFARSA
jgi:hypothetical protein